MSLKLCFRENIRFLRICSCHFQDTLTVVTSSQTKRRESTPHSVPAKKKVITPSDANNYSDFLTPDVRLTFFQLAALNRFGCGILVSFQFQRSNEKRLAEVVKDLSGVVQSLDGTIKTSNKSLNTLTNKNVDESAKFQKVLINLVRKYNSKLIFGKPRFSCCFNSRL